MKQALLVIDLQYGPFMRKEYDGKTVYQEDQLTANIKALAARARRAGAPVIFIHHTYGPEMPFMAKGEPLWDIHPGAYPETEDIRLDKLHPDAFQDSGLHEKLREMGVTDVVITGFSTEACVDTSCRSAYAHGYGCTLVSDGHSSFGTEALSAPQVIAHHNEILSIFAKVLPAEEIWKELG